MINFKDSYITAPKDVEPNDAFAIKVVAVAGFAGDWAAYCGPTDWPDEKIAKDGRKLTGSQSKRLFYVMRNRTYRE